MIGYQRGDSAAATELIDRLSSQLFRFFAAWGTAANDAEDLLQQCWLKIHRSRHTYRAGEPLSPWVFAIAGHTRLDAYRKRRRLEAREMPVASYREAVGSVKPAQESPGERISTLLAELPDAQREVIVLMKFAGMTVEEVARATSCTVGAVKQKAHRAYAKLRILLSERNEL